MKLFAAAALLAALAVPAIAGDQVEDQIKLFQFQPKALAVSAGTTVTWINGDDIEHSVTADQGAFDSGFFTKGGSFAFTFAKPGTYTYHCRRHPSMTATVTVAP